MTKGDTILFDHNIAEGIYDQRGNLLFHHNIAEVIYDQGR